jgi:hypothetical protein
VIGVCALGDGTIVGIGADHRLYARPNLAGWFDVPESGDVIAATVLADGTILGIGTDANLRTRDALFGRWQPVPDSGAVIDVI